MPDAADLEKLLVRAWKAWSRDAKRSARLIRPGGTLVFIVGPAEARPADGLAVDFVVEADRAQLREIVLRVRDDWGRTSARSQAS